jgi:hypothetical protein
MRPGAQALNALLRRLRANPLLSHELDALRARVEVLEAEVEALGETAAAERADVERLERPLVRIGLWLTGQLQSTEARERDEYEAVLAETMRHGDRVQRLRETLAGLGEVQCIDDDRVASVLRGVRRRDCPPDLRDLWVRVDRADELLRIAELCRIEEAQRGSKPTRNWRRARARAVRRIRKRLARLDRPSDGLDPQESDALRALRHALQAEASALQVGLATALRSRVVPPALRALLEDAAGPA